MGEQTRTIYQCIQSYHSTRKPLYSTQRKRKKVSDLEQIFGTRLAMDPQNTVLDPFNLEHFRRHCYLEIRSYNILGISS